VLVRPRSRRIVGLTAAALVLTGVLAVALVRADGDEPAPVRPPAPATPEPPAGWRTDGVEPAWVLGDGTAGFAAAASPGKPRRALRALGRGAGGAAVTWEWASAGRSARRTSGLLHTDPDGPATSGLRVEQVGDDIVLRDGDVALAAAPVREAVGPGHVGRLEVDGGRVRYLHDGQTLIDWTPWRGRATGVHGVLADDGDEPAGARVRDLAVEPLGADGAVLHLPYALDPTGARDETRALNDFVAGVPDGSTVRFPPGATVWSQSLVVTDRVGLTIDLNGSTLHQKAYPDGGSVPVIRVQGGRDFTLRDGRVRGSNPDGPDAGARLRNRVHCHGIDYRGVDGIDQIDVDVSDVWGDFIYIGVRKVGPATAGPSSYVQSRDARILGGHHSGSGRQGIAVVSLEGGRIGGWSARDRMVIDRVRRSSIDLEPLGYWERVSDLVLRHIEFGSGRLGVLAAVGAPPPAASELPPGFDVASYAHRTVERITAEDWYLPHRPFTGVVGSPHTSRRSGFVFRGIRSLADDGDRGTATGALFTMYGVDGVRFDDIRQSFSGRTPMHFARLVGSTGLVVGPSMDRGTPAATGATCSTTGAAWRAPSPDPGPRRVSPRGRAGGGRVRRAAAAGRTSRGRGSAPALG
jgi:hypothetical protein